MYAFPTTLDSHTFGLVISSIVYYRRIFSRPTYLVSRRLCLSMFECLTLLQRKRSTFSQATQWVLRSPWLFQRKALIISSKRWMTDFGTAIHNSVWIGILANTNLIKVIFPAKEWNFAFHPSNLLLTIWTSLSKYNSLHLPLYNGDRGKWKETI